MAGLLFLLLLLWAGWSGYHHYTRLDRLLQEQASPSGALVARIWCRRHCDEPEILVLTLSPASRDIRRGIGCDNCDTLVPGGDIPGEDRIMRPLGSEHAGARSRRPAGRESASSSIGRGLKTFRRR